MSQLLKECKGINKLAEEGLSEEVAQPLQFGRWVDVNQAKRKRRDLCSIFVAETTLLGRVKATNSKHTCQPQLWVYGVQGKGNVLG